MDKLSLFMYKFSNMSQSLASTTITPAQVTVSISGGLRGRRWRSTPVAGDSSMLLLVIGVGKARIELSDDTREVTTRHLIWVSQSDVIKLKLGAATDAVVCNISQDLFNRIVSGSSDANNLRTLQDMRTILSLDSERPSVERLDILLNELLVESANERGCQNTAQKAIVSLILVTLWRLLGSEQVSKTPSSSAVELLQNFRHLVEQHFRARWSIANYAKQLGINSTTLYDLCKRKLGRSPSDLIEERTLHEAKQLLIRSQLPISQIARVLGFNDSSYFSRFFSHHLDMTATQFRKSHLDAKLNIDELSEFSDWP